MARRTRKKKSAASNPMPILIGGIAAAAILALGYWFITRNSDGNGNFKPLPKAAYSDVGPYRGNSFSITAEVISKPRINTSIQVVEVKSTEGSTYVWIPAKVKGPNIAPKQHYIFNIKVTIDGDLYVQSYRAK